MIPAGTTCTATAGAFDLGSRRLLVQGTLGFAGPLVTLIEAGDVTVAPGGQLLGLGDTGVASNPGGSLRVVSQGTFKVERASSTLGLVSVSGPGGGGILDVSAQGAVVIDGRILAKGTNDNTSGGVVWLQALGGDLTVAGGGIEATAGGSEGDGGAVLLVADAGDVRIQGRIYASRGYCGACQIDVQAAGDFALSSSGLLEANSTNGFGDDGGLVEILAGGRLDVAGPITANGSGEYGSGGLVDIASTGGGDITISADISAQGANGGDGGSFAVATGGTIRISSTVTVDGVGIESGGGDAIVGDFSQDLPAAVVLSGVIRASGQDSGGDIDVLAAGSIDVAGKLQANGGFAGGVLILEGCRPTLAPTGLIDAQPAGTTVLRAGGPMVVQGAVKAGAGGSNIFGYRGTVPVVGAGAVVNPTAVVRQDFQIPCCTGVCPPAPTTTTTTIRVTTTIIPTTTSLVPTTTTAVPTTTTTGPSTTTTGAPATSTTASTTTTASASSTTIATSSTTAVPATTTTLASPTTTTVAPVPTTTTTIPVPATCEDLLLSGFEALGCRLELAGAVLGGETDATLGGSRSAKRFRAQLARARTAIDTARTGKRVTPSLRRAGKQLRAFDRGIKVASGRGMPPVVAARLRSLVTGAVAELDALARARRAQT